ncbi:MAG TPA: glycosyltransferase [Pyrinomonadaceae bacterium]|nr:glycosyltransferase [Pyrinomonadaceae bacterium]
MADTVLIVGQDSGWNLEASYGRAFKKQGWKVHFWAPVPSLHEHARGAKLGKLFSSFVNVEPWLRKANLSLLRLAQDLRPDFILVIATEGTRAGTLAQIKVILPKSPLFCLFPDGPHNLNVERISCLPLFDLIATSSPAWVKPFQTLGGREVRYLPFAADNDLHQPAPVMPSHDVGFIGNWRLEREEVLEQLVDLDLWLWGERWWKDRTRPGSALRARWKGKRATGEEFAKACASSRILLNLLDTPTWPGPNMRSFEQPACRAFSLATRTQAILEMFEEGENIECFDTIGEARDKISFYLKNESARQRIAESSYRFMLHGNTYADRAKQLLVWAGQVRL